MHYGIIAAGEGSRLAQEGVSLPKPLVTLGGEPMLGRLVHLFLRQGAESVSLIVNEQMTEVREYAEGLKQTLPVPFNLVVKSTPSSMHSFHAISSLMRGKGKFVLTTVDTIFREEDFARYVKAFEEADGIDGMMGITGFVDDEKPLYVETDAEGNILAFRDDVWPEARYVSAGIYGLTEPAIDILDDCLEQGVSRMRNYQRALIGGGLRLKGHDLGKVMDVDHASDLEKARQFLGV